MVATSSSRLLGGLFLLLATSETYLPTGDFRSFAQPVTVNVSLASGTGAISATAAPPSLGLNPQQQQVQRPALPSDLPPSSSLSSVYTSSYNFASGSPPIISSSISAGAMHDGTSVVDPVYVGGAGSGTGAGTGLPIPGGSGQGQLVGGSAGLGGLSGLLSNGSTATGTGSLVVNWNNVDLAIANGNAVTAQDGWVVKLRVQKMHNMVENCGATLISKDWILTAAHCFDECGLKYPKGNLNPTTGRCLEPHLLDAFADTKAFFGAADWTSTTAYVGSFAEVYIHPKFWEKGGVKAGSSPDASKPYDVALVKLSSPVPSQYRPLPYTCDAKLPADGSKVVSFGWGTCVGPNCGTMNNGHPYQLQWTGPTGVPVVSCGWFKPSEDYCIQGQGPLKGLEATTCAGDSGGPNVLYTSKGPLLVGITSWGDIAPCGTPGTRSGHLRVGSVCDWIKTTSKIGPNTPPPPVKTCTLPTSWPANVGGPSTTCKLGATMKEGDACDVSCVNGASVVKVLCESGSMLSPPVSSTAVPLSCPAPTPTCKLPSAWLAGANIGGPSTTCVPGGTMKPGDTCKLGCSNGLSAVKTITCGAGGVFQPPFNPSAYPLKCIAPTCGIDGSLNSRMSQSFSANVKAIQSRLNYYGAELAVDGFFGSCTDNAVRAFQSANKLGAMPDGIVGPVTTARLCSSAAVSIPSSAVLADCKAVKDYRRVNALWAAEGGIKISRKPCDAPSAAIGALPACKAFQYYVGVQYTVQCPDGTKDMWIKIVYNSAPAWHRITTKNNGQDTSVVMHGNPACACLGQPRVPNTGAFDVSSCPANADFGVKCSIKCSPGYSLYNPSGPATASILCAQSVGWIGTALPDCVNKNDAFGGHSFVFVPRDQFTWDACRFQCQAFGGDLLVIKNANDLQLAGSICNQRGQIRCYVGGYANKTTLAWTWLDGSNIGTGLGSSYVPPAAGTYTGWAPSQPDGVGTDPTCLSVRSSSPAGPWGWDNYSCDQPLTCLCSQAPLPTLTAV